MVTEKPLWTIGKCLTWTTEFFQKHHLDTPRLEAEVLLGRALDQERVQLYVNLDQPLQGLELARYRSLIQQRIAGTPTAYLLGEKEFMSLSFEVNRKVLIPRPDTETLVEAALTYSQSQGDTPREHPQIIVDVGTGCGNIALSLAAELPQAQVYAVDISPEALEVAQRNAQRHDLDQRVRFLEGDLLYPLEDLDLAGRVDLIVANLPYISATELPYLAPEVLQEPLIALDGGSDGLRYYRQLIPQALEYLKIGGYLLFEIAPEQRKLALKLLEAEWEELRLHQDYAGRDRVVAAKLATLEAEQFAPEISFRESYRQAALLARIAERKGN